MDRRERYNDPEEMMRIAMSGNQAQLWTALPCIIQSFNPEAMTCEAQPTVNGMVRQQDGTSKEVQLPMLLDCPVFFPGGGGLTLTFPIKPGDECLVIFASRCIDSWWQLGGIHGQAEIRMHDLSDGFVFAGVRSQPRAFDVSTSAAQLRTDDGGAFVEINATTKNITASTSGNITANANGNINATAGGEAKVTAPTIKLIGNVVVTGDISISGDVNIASDLSVTGQTIGSGINLNTHQHTGVQAGGDNTGGPV